jgi:hypothetical protein
MADGVGCWMENYTQRFIRLGRGGKMEKGIRERLRPFNKRNCSCLMASCLPTIGIARLEPQFLPMGGPNLAETLSVVSSISLHSYATSYQGLNK